MRHALPRRRLLPREQVLFGGWSPRIGGRRLSARLCLLVRNPSDNAVAGLSETLKREMAPHGSQFSTELELLLREGLAALRAAGSEMGANSISVFLIINGRTVRNLYLWPESGMERAEVQLERALASLMRNFAGYASENSPIARFLQRAFQPGGTSFLLFCRGTDRLNVAVAFGFVASPTPEGLAASQMPPLVGLASVATWSVYEVFRLHSELVVVNERLGTRKLIERAKGVLQAERGLDEQQAYAHLRKLSRQRRMRMSEVATDLLGAWRFP
jgi:hypothetical protein